MLCGCGDLKRRCNVRAHCSSLYASKRIEFTRLRLALRRALVYPRSSSTADSTLEPEKTLDKNFGRASNTESDTLERSYCKRSRTSLTVRCFCYTIPVLLCLRTGLSASLMLCVERKRFIGPFVNSLSAEKHLGASCLNIQAVSISLSVISQDRFDTILASE